MKRFIDDDLLEWKSSAMRKPLLVRGARQVGKTYAITQFLEKNFHERLIVNFDRNPAIQKIFELDLNPVRILRELELYFSCSLKLDRAALFFDEIQECPRAIMAMRYFYEEMPQLHVIGAGSLLEFVLQSRDFKMPVGRIDYLWMKPLSFGEYLDACGHEALHAAILKAKINEKPSDLIHEKLLGLMKEYSYVGGMPAAVYAHVKGASFKEVRELQESLLRTFRDDFGKYASRAKQKYLDNVFLGAVKLTGKHFKYTHVDPTVRMTEIKAAFELLLEAGLFYKVRHTAASGLPLEADASEKKFKIVSLDVGLMQTIFGMNAAAYFSEDVLALHQGALSEQIVGQELLVYASRSREERLFFWGRDERGSSAEVDYLWTHEAQYYPVEVKSGSTGRLKSLRIFMREKKMSMGVRVSTLPLDYKEGLLSVPIYALDALPKFMEDIKTSGK